MNLPTVCAVTMAFNEGGNLPRWQQWYGSQLGLQNCLVVNHGSTDGSIAALAPEVGRMFIPRDRGFHDGIRATAIADIVKALLAYYDAVIYTDSDEFVVADPRKYPSLRHFLAQNPEPSHFTALGFNVWHRIDEEGPLDSRRPLLQQRSHIKFIPAMCKTAIVRKPVGWGGGFHTSTEMPNFGDLFLLHTKNADMETCLARTAITRDVEWTEGARGGNHQRRDDDQIVSAFQKTQALPVKDWSDPDMQALIAGLMNGIATFGNPKRGIPVRYGLNGFKPVDFQHLYRLPEAFRTLF